MIEMRFNVGKITTSNHDEVVAPWRSHGGDDVVPQYGMLMMDLPVEAAARVLE